MVNFVAKDIYTKDSIQRGGQDVIIEKHEIQIDQITSGKVNIFTFYRNRKQIDDHFYDCKNHRLQQTTSSIFILMQRACIYCRKSFGVYPYDGSETIHDWTEKMKAELQHRSKQENGISAYVSVIAF